MLNRRGAKGRIQVLLIEGNQAEALVMRSWLEEGGLEVTLAADGLQGLAMIDSQVWDLVVTDVELVGISGLDLLKTIKAADRTTPVLVITATKSAENAQEALHRRADALLFKPLSKSRFLYKVQMLRESTNRPARERRVVLAIGAHPDDVEIGCGGTLDKHREAGDAVVILTLSEGRSGGDPQTRRREAQNAAKLLGAQLRWGGLPDTEIPAGGQTIEVIEHVVRELKPTHLLTHSVEDTHQDHRNTHNATLVAAREVPNVYCYQSPSSMANFLPQLFIDISGHLDAKLRAIAAFSSQTAQRAYLQEDLIRATARYWGRFAGYVMAEPMTVLRHRDP